MNKAQFIERVADHIGKSPSEVTDTVRGVFEVIACSLAAGEELTVANFGTFYTAERSAHLARNPDTGERVQVDTKRVPRYRPTGRIREMVANSDTTASIRKPGSTPKKNTATG